MALAETRVTRLIKRGLPVRADGRIDVTKAEAWITHHCVPQAQFTDRGVSKIVPPPAVPTPPATEELAALDGDEGAVLPLPQAKALRETYLAKMAQLEYGARSRMLLDAAEVEATWRRACAALRARLLAVPSRCGSRLSYLTPHDIAEINHEIRAALTELGTGGGDAVASE